MKKSNAFKTAYSTSQYADNYPDGIENHWWSRARADILRSAVAPFRGKRILDVGCGRGLTVDALRQSGFECFGCEIATPNIDLRVADYVMTGVDACKIDADFRRRVDILMLLDVIEHIAEPSKFLDDLFAAFPNAAHVVLTVPARSELWTVWDDRYGHYRRYDRKSLRELLVGAGLHVMTLRYIFRSLYPILLLAAKAKARSARASAPRWLLAHRMIAWWFASEAKILQASPVWGTSLLAICNRQRPAS